MIDLFKDSSERQRSILMQQIEDLTALDAVEASSRDTAWRARRDFALCVARDVIKQVLPPDSALYATYAQVLETPTEPIPLEGGIEPYELELYKLALEKVTWHSISNSAGSMPSAFSQYSQVERALPEMVYRHPAFKIIIATLVALVVFAFTGVFKFYGLSFSIDKQIQEKTLALNDKFDKQKMEIEAKQNALNDEFDKQKIGIESVLDARRKESDVLTSRLKTLDATETDVGHQLDQLRDSAQRTLSKFTTDASGTINVETDKSLKKLRSALDEAQTETVKQATAAGDKRVKEIMALDGGASFQKAIHDFEQRIISANDAMKKLDDRQKVFEGRQLIIGSATKLLDNPSPHLVDKLSAYFKQALWVVWGTGAALTLLLLSLVILLIIGIFKKT